MRDMLAVVKTPLFGPNEGKNFTVKIFTNENGMEAIKLMNELSEKYLDNVYSITPCGI